MAAYDLVSISELFEAAKINNVKKAREVLDAGLDINAQDADRGSTALHIATSHGAKQVVELLVQRGADLNIKDIVDKTALHNLMDKRLDVLAMWLVHKGASLYIRDRKGFTPYDYAPNFLQKELLQAAAAAGNSSADAPLLYKKVMPELPSMPSPMMPTPMTTAAETNARASAPPREVRTEIMKIHVKGGRSYKTMRVSSNMSVADLITSAAEKFNLTPECAQCLDLLEKTRTEERRMAPSEDLFDVKGRWPTILGANGNETHLYYQFMLALKVNGATEGAKAEWAKLQGL